jgi:hypothetical protein
MMKENIIDIEKENYSTKVWYGKNNNFNKKETRISN